MMRLQKVGMSIGNLCPDNDGYVALHAAVDLL
jgi:hypothetical protein